MKKEMSDLSIDNLKVAKGRVCLIIYSQLNESKCPSRESFREPASNSIGRSNVEFCAVNKESHQDGGLH